MAVKPNNEKSKLSILYRGAISWNAIKADVRNMPFRDFKVYHKKYLINYFNIELIESSVLET